MSENFIHLDHMVEDRGARPGGIAIGANIQTQLDGVSKEENVVRLDRTKIEVEEIRESLARVRRLKAEMEGDA